MTLAIGSRVVVTKKYPDKENLFIGQTGTVVDIDRYYVVKFDKSIVGIARFTREEIAEIEENNMALAADSFSIIFRDSGGVVFRSPGYDGESWAVPEKIITWEQARQIAKILGPEAEAALKAREVIVQDRLLSKANALQSLVHESQQAAERLRVFRKETQK